MQGVESFEIIGAQQARLTNKYRNTKHKLHKTNASDEYMYVTHYMHLVGIARSACLPYQYTLV